MGERVARVGVVVLNWNGREHLGPCLDSLLRSDHPDFVVVVVDNGSRDGSVEYLRERGDVELVALEENRRFSGGNNAGAQRAIEMGADVLLILNNDTTIDPGALSALSDAVAGEGFGLAAPRIVFADDPGRIWYGGGSFSPWTGYVGHRAIRRPVDAGADAAGETDWVTGCALAIRADLWQRLGGLDSAYYIYAEDVDLCLRARDLDETIAYRPNAVVCHAVSASVGGGSSPFKAYHRTRARRQLLRRHGRGPWWPLGLWVQDVSWALLRWLEGNRAAARAVFDAMREPEDSEPGYRVEDQFPDRGDPA
jgi:GT2 family glycosyltransferase